MIQINGSYGEGGGQILRAAISLSVVTQTPVEIINIRANRPNPGIKPQHFTALSIVKKLSQAKTEGLDIGSSQVIFHPGPIQGGSYHFHIGTAGSITLVFQTCLLSCLRTKHPIAIRVTGGTDVKWSPSWDYFASVFLSLLRKMGMNANTQLLRRGYYPRGGGEAILKIHPSKTLNPLVLDSRPNYDSIQGKIHLANLPGHIGKRMKHAALSTLIDISLSKSIAVESISSPSSGVGVTLWATSPETIIGATGLGERGIPAESIGEQVANTLLKDLTAGVSLDIHALDQLIPYLMLAIPSGQSKCLVRDISNHAKTNMWLVNQFCVGDELFSIEKKDGIFLVKSTVGTV